MPKPKNERFWSVKAERDAESGLLGHLYLYGPIASTTWWGDEVSPQLLLADIASLGDIDELRVHIFSDGGDVFAGNAIYSIMKQMTVPVDAYIEGIAASAATVPPCAARNVYISRNGMMMVHHPMLGLMGYYNKAQLMVMHKDLAKITEPLIATYQSRTGMSREDVENMLDGEDGGGTWFNAQEAIDAGLADGFIPEEADGAMDAVAMLEPNVYEWQGVRMDLSQYANAPALPGKRRTKNMAKKTETMIPETGAEVDAAIKPEAAPMAQVPPASEIPPDGTAGGDVKDAALTVESQDDADGGVDGETGVSSFEDGVKAERARIVALDGILAACPGCGDIVGKAKAEGWSYEQASKAVFDHMTKNPQGTGGYLNARKNEYENSGAAGVKGAAASGEEPPDQVVNSILVGMKKGR